MFPLLAGISLASNEGAETRLKSSVDQVVTTAKQAKDRAALIAKVKPVLENILDFQIMTRRAVGPGWREFNSAQQMEATGLFTTLILRTYTAKFTPGEYPDVIYKTSSSPAPGRVEIPTTAEYKGSRYDVIYRMEDKGGWLITDVVIEGVSLVANYRSQFDAQFKQGGVDAVLNALHRSVDESK
ncbi:MAG: ABC transporter substrate-binding protein [Verrucomicrobia bacterium]|nr:ABC transporter substrate-binding protein [Verrucomicrobiota bacterium]